VGSSSATAQRQQAAQQARPSAATALCWSWSRPTTMTSYRHQTLPLAYSPPTNECELNFHTVPLVLFLLCTVGATYRSGIAMSKPRTRMINKWTSHKLYSSKPSTMNPTGASNAGGINFNIGYTRNQLVSGKNPRCWCCYSSATMLTGNLISGTSNLGGGN
jgi:hypothetical protein